MIISVLDLFSIYKHSETVAMTVASIVVTCIQMLCHVFFIFSAGLVFETESRAFQFAIRIDSIRYANRFVLLKNRPFDSLVVMQFLH